MTQRISGMHPGGFPLGQKLVWDGRLCRLGGLMMGTVMDLGKARKVGDGKGYVEGLVFF